MTRERITVSMQDTLIKQIDRLIDKQNIRNRSHAIESILAQAIGANEITVAVVFIGGQYAEQAFAASLDALKQVEKQGIEHCFLVLGEYGQAIQEQLRSINEAIRVTIHQTSEGSGGALREIADALPERFCMINVVHPIKIRWEDLVAYHQKYKPLLTLQTEAGSTYQGVSIAEKTAIAFVPPGFSIIEKSLFPLCIKKSECIVIPPLPA